MHITLSKIQEIADKVLFPPHRKIWHLYIVITILFVLPILCLSFFTLFDTYRSATKFALSENKSEAFLIANILRERLDLLAEFGAAIAQRPDLINSVKECRWDEAIKAVDRVPLDFEYVDRVLLVDKQGVVKAQVPNYPNYVGLKRSDTGWYRGVTRQWQTTVSQVYVDPIIPNRNIISVAVPIKILSSLISYDVDNTYDAGNPEQFGGILLLHVPVKIFANLVKEESMVDPGEFIYIVDDSGNLVAHPKFQEISGIIDYKQAPVVQKLLAGKHGSEVNYNPIEKEKRVVAFECVQKYRWGVVVVKPYVLAFAERNKSIKSVVIIYSIALILSLFVVVLIVFVLAERRRIDVLKDDFVSTVSHEIRNPLFAIRESVAQVTEGIRGPITKEQNDFLVIALTSIDRLSRIINDLLDVSKMEAGKLRLNFKWCNIVETSRRVSSVFLSQAKTKGVEIRERLPVEPAYIFIDEGRVEQVFFNLISNALKFTQRGFIEVEIIDKKDAVECLVSDSGIGIHKEQLSGIFSKLKKYVSTSRGRGKGTGLGLAITKEVISMHGGNISIASTVDKGTTVTFSLPKYSPQEATARFLDNVIPIGNKKRSLEMIFYDIGDLGRLKSKLGNEKTVFIRYKLVKLIYVNIRRVSGDILLIGENAFLILLPQLDAAHATLVAKKIDDSINDYLAAEALSAEVKINSLVITYPQVNNNKEIFAKIINLIAECKMRK
ncbi:MAG: sensor histidine kinase [Candidatus Omnitrophota bacterium]